MGTEVTANIESIIKQIKTYQTDAPIELVQKAYQFACDAHQGQLRVSGEAYIIHPLCVAQILADLQIDAITISAALLHDVVEDTDITLEDLEKQFGKEIAKLVDGVTKLSRFEYKSKEEQQLENYRKMFLAMAKDIRVVLIKLADRLHNMRTLKYMPECKQRATAQETQEIFAPLAHRLGISSIKWELEDLSFRYLEPEKYYELVEKVKQKRKEREAIINDAIKTLSERLKVMGIKGEIQGRAKNFYSIYKKMQKGHKELNEIFDLLAIRVLVDTVKDCYGCLGLVHTLWKPLPGRFKDYIAMPKSNMYQSLHTTVMGTHGQPLEIQIRTWEMHRTAEYGIAAHWRYKDGGKGADKDFDQKLAWLRQLLEWQQDMGDPREFMETLKLDVFSDEVFVFTPKGDVVDLPAGSIPIDFAYRIHTDVGHRCVGAKVNGKIVPLEYKLANGDIVEIITAKQSNGPSRDWLNIVGSPDTRNKIRNWFRKERREENIAKGREIIERESKKMGYDWRELAKGDRLLEIAKKLNFATEDDLLAALGYGGATPHGILVKLIEAQKKDARTSASHDLAQMLGELKPRKVKTKGQGILVSGEPGVMVRLARCCNPIPGDIIVGYITRGRGVSVHRAECPNILNNPDEYERMIDVEWDVSATDLYQVAVEISAVDRPGLLSDIMMVASDSKTNISSVNARVHSNKMATISLSLAIHNVAQLEHIMAKMRRVKDVYSVHRITPREEG